MSAAARMAGSYDMADPPLTHGTIALLNLQAQIDALEREVSHGHASAEGRVGLIELITLRGLILGHIADYRLAADIAEQLVRDAATDGTAFIARARTRAVFHRFMDALDDVDRAERLAVDADTAARERAAIFQALGRYDEALVIRQEAADRRASFENVAALVGLHAERGEIDASERLYAASYRRYTGVSPFPLALLDFQMGLMWMNEGRLAEARASFAAARVRVPAFAPAQGHLAEVEAEFGEVERAIARLAPLAASSDDPDYAAQLARILNYAGRAREARHWCRLAAARYDELIASHPEAFADHAAEFWLAAGANPAKALRLARMNLDVRQTPRAYHLLAQATAAK
jgi:tetratricopeptide (TPR) repeat protein